MSESMSKAPLHGSYFSNFACRWSTLCRRIYRQESIPDGVLVAQSLTDAMQKLSSASYSDDVESVFVIGGASAFDEALSSSALDKLYITEVQEELECDKFVTKHRGDHLTTIAVSVSQPCPVVVPLAAQV